jgi:hypothetical protein
MSQTPPPPPPAAATGRGQIGQIRQPLVVFLLSLVTCSIYVFVWHYKTFKEMKDYSGEGIGGALALIYTFITVGIIINWFVLPSEVGNLYARDGKEKPVSGTTGLWLLLPIVGYFIWLWKAQGRLNDFWRSKGATG